MINYSRYEITGRDRIRFYIITCISFMAIGYIFYDSLFVSLIFVFLSFPYECHYRKQRLCLRRRELLIQFRDMIYSLSASISTGRPMEEALQDAERGLLLLYDENAPICIELKHMVKRMNESNESAESLLLDFASRSQIPEIQNLAEIYSICKSTGGDFEKLLRKTVDILSDKLEFTRELHVLTAQKKTEIKILLAIPFIVILFLRITSRDYISIMYDTSAGVLLMTLALISIACAYFWSISLIGIDL